ncbi:hypothetical protein [Actinocorallia aurantiaca]|uniref:Uncharacterized protein n=1 Tax=Actinocorallia aurantiaca TaxID=46204 RepID=A0ABN3UBN6_9ACTN
MIEVREPHKRYGARKADGVRGPAGPDQRASPQVVPQKMTQTSDMTTQNAGNLGARPSFGLAAVRLAHRDA